MQFAATFNFTQALIGLGLHSVTGADKIETLLVGIKTYGRVNPTTGALEELQMINVPIDQIGTYCGDPTLEIEDLTIINRDGNGHIVPIFMKIS